MNPDRIPTMDIQIVPPPERPISSRVQRALSTRPPDSVRAQLLIDESSTKVHQNSSLSSMKSPIDEFQLAWLQIGTRHDTLEKTAAEENNEQRKQQLMTEQVLADQLSRCVLSDIEQEVDRHKPLLLQQQPRRNLDRRMHDTR
jgi:hypothetical protein